MTNEQAREYWCRKLERAEGYSDEHWDAEERHAHREYVDALKCAVTALAICREHEAAKKPKTNGDKIRVMTDEKIAEMLDIYAIDEICDYCIHQGNTDCSDGCNKGILEWLKQDIDEC